VKIFLEDKPITYYIRDVETRKEEIVTLLEVMYTLRERRRKTFISRHTLIQKESDEFGLLFLVA
jgi:hypothetical protein